MFSLGNLGGSPNRNPTPLRHLEPRRIHHRARRSSALSLLPRSYSHGIHATAMKSMGNFLSLPPAQQCPIFMRENAYSSIAAAFSLVGSSPMEYPKQLLCPALVLAGERSFKSVSQELIRYSLSARWVRHYLSCRRLPVNDFASQQLVLETQLVFIGSTFFFPNSVLLLVYQLAFSKSETMFFYCPVGSTFFLPTSSGDQLRSQGI